MDDVFDVFVIGPMGDDRDDPAESSTPISQHMANIAKALNRILPDVCPTRFNVNTPQDGGADIVDGAFNWIDRADMAIADITARSPSVMYELAYFHALGTPVIVIDDKRNPIQTTPFYLQGANVVRVPDFDVGTLASELGSRISMYFNESDDQDFSVNPISKFYSAPLVEVSGASSIARGYYLNLVNAFVNAGSGVFAKYPDEKFESFTLIKPTGDFEINTDLQRFGSIARQWNGGKALAEKTWEITMGGRSRPVSAYYMDGHVIDYPRTIATIKNSPRYLRVLARGQSSSGGRVSDEVVRAAKNKVSQNLINHFFTVVKREIIRNSDSIFSDKYRWITLDDLEAEFL